MAPASKEEFCVLYRGENYVPLLVGLVTDLGAAWALVRGDPYLVGSDVRFCPMPVTAPDSDEEIVIANMGGDEHYIALRGGRGAFDTYCRAMTAAAEAAAAADNVAAVDAELS
jgi:hypothetical protein